MNKNLPISCTLLALLAMTNSFAVDNIPVTASVVAETPVVATIKAPVAVSAPDFLCAEWKSNVNIDVKELDNLQKKVARDKPEIGLLYTKKQFVVLLGKNLAKAKDILANSKAKLPRTSEGKVDLKDVTLNGFNLSGLNFDNVDFKGAEMNGVDLSDSSFRDASLAKAELEGANLNNANLSFANLTKTVFINASLCHATLVSAELEDAVLRGASLKDAKLDNAKNIPPNIYPNAQAILQFGLPVPPIN